MLLAHAGALDPALTRAGAALAVLGFATKAGLAPTHSWLPDAHSQAPATVSGLMSGVLLSVAFYAILRVQAITDAALGPDLMRVLLTTAGLLSLAVTAGLVITQKDFKRLLAYSSIEHMGLLALGAAAGGPLAIAAVLLHMLGHGLVKSSMFVLAGRILGFTGSHDIADVRNLLRRRPDLGGPFLLGAAALLGFPPFVTFFTEVAIIVAGFQRGLGWQMIARLRAAAGGVRRDRPARAGDDRRRRTPTRTPPAPRTPRRTCRRGSARSRSGSPSASARVLGFAAWPLAAPLLDCRPRPRRCPMSRLRPPEIVRVTGEQLVEAIAAQLARGFRLALVAGHEDGRPGRCHASGSSTSCSARPGSGSRWSSRSRARTPGCRPSPASPTRPDGSSASCATCTASCRATTRSPTGWCATATGRPATTRCWPTPTRPRLRLPRGLPVRGGHRQGRLRDPGRPGARRPDRARPLPVLRRRGDDRADVPAALLRPSRRGEAVRGTRGRRTGSRSPSGSAATPPSATASPT